MTPSVAFELCRPCGFSSKQPSPPRLGVNSMHIKRLLRVTAARSSRFFSEAGPGKRTLSNRGSFPMTLARGWKENLNKDQCCLLFLCFSQHFSFYQTGVFWTLPFREAPRVSEGKHRLLNTEKRLEHHLTSRYSCKNGIRHSKIKLINPPKKKLTPMRRDHRPIPFPLLQSSPLSANHAPPIYGILLWDHLTRGQRHVKGKSQKMTTNRLEVKRIGFCACKNAYLLRL